MSVAMRRLASIVSALTLAAFFGTANAQVTIHLTTTTQATCDVTTDANGLRLGANGTDLTATGVTLSGTGCGGGGGAPTPNNFPLVVLPAAPITGTPFTVSWAVTGATSCSGSASLNGSSTSLSGWTDVTTATTPRTVTASTAGTYSLSLTCSNTSGSVTSAPATVVVAQGSGGDSCPVSPRTRATVSDIHYLPETGGPHVRHNVDLTVWNNIWGYIDENGTTPIPWPGSSGSSPTIWTLGKTQYLAAKFHTGAVLSGFYKSVSYGAGPLVDAAISQTCGDFAPADVGCRATSISSQDQAFMHWKPIPSDNFHCGLLPNTDYYFNMQFQDINTTGPGCSGTTCKITISHTHN